MPWVPAGMTILREAPYTFPFVSCPFLSAPQYLGAEVSDGLMEGSGIFLPKACRISPVLDTPLSFQ